VAKTFFPFILACFFVLAPWCLGAAASASEYHGQVTFNGLPVPGATVTARHGAMQFSTSTDPQGLYSFSELPDGKWTLEIRMTEHACGKMGTEAAPPGTNEGRNRRASALTLASRRTG